MTAIARTGHQEAYRNLTKDERMAFGQQHAPAVVNPPRNVCQLCKSATLLRQYVSGHGYCCLDCAEACKQWQEVLDMMDSADEEYFGYAPTCGIKSRQRFAHDLLMETFASFAEAELAIMHCLNDLVEADGSNSNLQSLLIARNALIEGFNSAAHIYLSAVGNCRISSKTNSYTSIDMAWHATVAYDYYARRRYPVKFIVDNRASLASQKSIDVTPYAPQIDKTAPISNESDGAWGFTRVEQIKAQRGPDSLATEQRWHDAQKAEAAKRGNVNPELKPAPVIPQLLQSREDVLETIAMSNAPVDPKKIDELMEAVKVAVAEWNTNTDARILPDGYYLTYRPDVSHPTWITLHHPNHPNRVIVGMRVIGGETLEFATSRGELREYMFKVAAGMAPSTNSHLPGVMMQQPISEDARQSPLRSGNNQHAEVVPEELPLFAGQDPEPAA
jgi:hypothetical protein